MAACRNTARERMEHSAAARVLDPIAQFQLYEDYLDSKVTPMDLFYSKVSHSRTFDAASWVCSVWCATLFRTAFNKLLN